MAQYPEEMRQAAKSLFLRRHTITEIHKSLKISKRTLYYWRDTDHWDDLLKDEAPLDAATRRLVLLLNRENKEPKELKEIETLVRTMEKLQRQRQRESQAARQQLRDEGTYGGDTTVKPNGSARKRGRKKVKNDVSHLTETDFAEQLHKHYFRYQHELREAKDYRNRQLLKSRQIGATWYFAQEAFEDACLTGDNQIFLSATRAQAEVFRQYIIAVALEKFDIELKGNPITLNTAKGLAQLHFLSNNSLSAQGYSGHVYIDEYFWILKFKELYKLATGMAAHSKWRRTLFSTPSVVTHEAYPYWTGKNKEKQFTKAKFAYPTFKQLQSGIYCPDNTWRKIITLDDAMQGGCDLFDKDELLMEYTPDEFEQLFNCQFVDDTFGVFKLADLDACMTYQAKWDDFNPRADRPFGNRPVWCGYDPSRTRDDASFVVLSPSLKPGGDFRLLERKKWINKSFRWQAEQIQLLTKRYNIQFMGIDTTGPGIGVFEQVQRFYPQATPIHYGQQTKTQLVLKAQDIIESHRLKWDSSLMEIANAFLTVKKTTTQTGGITYAANRSKETGHADVAWAIMHALSNEPLAGPAGGCVVAIG